MEKLGKATPALAEELLHSSASTLPFTLSGLLAPGLWRLGLCSRRGLSPHSVIMGLCTMGFWDLFPLI